MLKSARAGVSRRQALGVELLQHTNVPFEAPGTKPRQCLGRPTSSRGLGRGLARATVRAVGSRPLHVGALSSFPRSSTQWCDPAWPNAAKGRAGKAASLQPGPKTDEGGDLLGHLGPRRSSNPAQRVCSASRTPRGASEAPAMPARGGLVLFVLRRAGASRLLWERPRRLWEVGLGSRPGSVCGCRPIPNRLP